MRLNDGRNDGTFLAACSLPLKVYVRKLMMLEHSFSTLFQEACWAEQGSTSGMPAWDCWSTQSGKSSKASFVSMHVLGKWGLMGEYVLRRYNTALKPHFKYGCARKESLFLNFLYCWQIIRSNRWAKLMGLHFQGLLERYTQCRITDTIFWLRNLGLGFSHNFGPWRSKLVTFSRRFSISAKKRGRSSSMFSSCHQSTCSWCRLFPYQWNLTGNLSKIAAENTWQNV